jgi:hypothetical protein
MVHWRHKPGNESRSEVVVCAVIANGVTTLLGIAAYLILRYILL